MYELPGSVRDAYGELLRHQELLVGLGARFGEGGGESSLRRFAHRDGPRRGLRYEPPQLFNKSADQMYSPEIGRNQMGTLYSL